MFIHSIKITVISIIFIFLIHNLFSFFKSTLTVPKFKDLVDAPIKKYETMFNVLSSNNNSKNKNLTASDTLKPDTTTMKNELKSFLKKTLKGGGSNEVDERNLSDKNTTDIAFLDTMNSNNNNNYSVY